MSHRENPPPSVSCRSRRAAEAPNRRRRRRRRRRRVLCRRRPHPSHPNPTSPQFSCRTTNHPRTQHAPCCCASRSRPGNSSARFRSRLRGKARTWCRTCAPGRVGTGLGCPRLRLVHEKWLTSRVGQRGMCVVWGIGVRVIGPPQCVCAVCSGCISTAYITSTGNATYVTSSALKEGR